MNLKIRRSTLLSLVVLVVLCLATGTLRTEAAVPAYTRDGASVCVDCHGEGRGDAIFKTPHAQSADKRTPFAEHECESCHGISSEHMRMVPGSTIRPLPTVIFGAGSPTPVEKQNEVCLGCHEGGLRINWTGSQHEAADTSCASCHLAHAVKDPVLVRKSQAEACYDCHSEQRAQSHRRSRHPIKEGKVICSDCHNPHGSFGPGLLRESSVNDTCYKCHAEKRGPFLWEHAPVRDDCANCHTPHGSNLTKLLKARTPWLCQECHQENYHPSSLYSGTGLPSFSPDSSMLGKDCMNCHPKIHGSNHPSGPRFTR